jgi:hypothetical protein
MLQSGRGTAPEQAAAMQPTTILTGNEERIARVAGRTPSPGTTQIARAHPSCRTHSTCGSKWLLPHASCPRMLLCSPG